MRGARARAASRDELATSLASSLVVMATGGVLATVTLWAMALANGASSAGAPAQVLLAGSAATLATTAISFVQRVVGGSTPEQLAEIAHRATHDELTGLPNRDELTQRLEAALIEAYRHDRVVGVLFLDLDGFKAVNDLFGHDAGDDLLRAFGERLREVVRANDVVARLGGDEFVVVCQGINRPSAVEEVAHNIRRAFDRPLGFGKRESVVAASIGVSVASRSDPSTPLELISQADQAMYRAKRDRCGVQVFDDAHRREVLDRREVERALVPALAQGQFRVHYQPVVSVSRAEVVSLEALLRWKHPLHGIVGTDRFLPVAEEAGMLGRLSEMVLREATAQISAWNELYPGADELTVAINLAEGQLVDPGFPARLAEVLRWSGLDASRLVLELAEDMFLGRADEAAGVLRALGDMGVKLAVDDFGTGRIAIARTQSLDLVDHIKIDRTLVEASTVDDVARALIEGAVSMASSLGIDVIGEGVESESQRDVLEQLGVDLMQGYLFVRPLSSTEFEERGIATGPVFGLERDSAAGQP